MSVSFSVYLGPYLRVPKVNVTKTIPTLVCSSGCTDAKVSLGAKFCPNCGAPTQQTQVVSEQLKPLYSGYLSPEFVDWFWTPESCVGKSESIWLPNHRGVGQVFGAYTGFSFEQIQPLSPDFVLESQQAFSSKYKGVLQALLQRFSRAPDLCVGPVPYFS